jgi:hypothetical protein
MLIPQEYFAPHAPKDLAMLAMTENMGFEDASSLWYHTMNFLQENIKMGQFKGLFFALIIAFSLAVGQVAEGADYISIYTTGKVTEYKAGKTIDVLDGEGDRHTYVITEDTDMPEKIQVGMTVEVSGEQIVAIKIEVLSE